MTNFSDRSHFLQTLFPPVSQFGWFGWFIHCWSTEHQMQSQWTPLLWHHDIFYPNGEPFSYEEVELIKNLTESVNGDD